MKVVRAPLFDNHRNTKAILPWYDTIHAGSPVEFLDGLERADGTTLSDNHETLLQRLNWSPGPLLRVADVHLDSLLRVRRVVVHEVVVVDFIRLQVRRDTAVPGAQVVVVSTQPIVGRSRGSADEDLGTAQREVEARQCGEGL